jgi:hypothetical protein
MADIPAGKQDLEIACAGCGRPVPVYVTSKAGALMVKCIPRAGSEGCGEIRYPGGDSAQEIWAELDKHHAEEKGDGPTDRDHESRDETPLERAARERDDRPAAEAGSGDDGSEPPAAELERDEPAGSGDDQAGSERGRGVGFGFLD